MSCFCGFDHFLHFNTSCTGLYFFVYVCDVPSVRCGWTDTSLLWSCSSWLSGHKNRVDALKNTVKRDILFLFSGHSLISGYYLKRFTCSKHTVRLLSYLHIDHTSEFTWSCVFRPPGELNANVYSPFCSFLVSTSSWGEYLTVRRLNALLCSQPRWLSLTAWCSAGNTQGF